MIRVLIVHDFSLICNLLTAALRDAPDIEVVGCARSIQEALKSAENGEIDVALVGIRMAEQGALKVTEAIGQADPQIKVLVFGLSDEHEQILPFIEAGAAGYVQKDDSVAELMDAIRAAHSGKALVSPEIAAALIQRLTKWAHLIPEGGSEMIELGKLTPREREVLDLLMENLSNHEIAERLSIETGTVKLHIHNILRKLGVNSRQRATTIFAIFHPPPKLPD
jgi:DNA-binding NarL/FixJ family response regulator